MLQETMFRRKFSVNLYKSKRLTLSEMSFGELPLKTERGDIYPCILKKGAFQEKCECGRYVFLPEEGRSAVSHLMGGFNPYSTYEIEPDALSEGAKAGFSVLWPENALFVYARYENGKAVFGCDYAGEHFPAGEISYEKGMKFLFTFHAGIYIEMYAETNGVIKHIGDVRIQALECLRNENVFSRADACMYVEACEDVKIRKCSNYLDSGIMQADLKPVKYENGEVMVENGKIYITYTSRFETEMMQQVASYKLSTGEITLEGALLFDAGDGKWCGDVATTLIFDRNAKKWRIWMCVFSHGHVLAYGETENELRFGVNVVDVNPLAKEDLETAFGGREGDEDPDLYFDEAENRWYLAVCRKDAVLEKYRYYLFSSDRPDKGFKFVSRTEDSIETTGGSFVKINGEVYFVFGRSFSEMSKYDVCAMPDMKKLGELKCNHPDGGFRGWGSVMEIPCGTRKRLLWITFDRTRGSEYNWSYGNLYFYESDTFKMK